MSTAKAWPLSATLALRSNAATFSLRHEDGAGKVAEALSLPHGTGSRSVTAEEGPRVVPTRKHGCAPVKKVRLKWTGQRRACSAGCPTLNFHHAVNHHGQPEEETPPEDEQAQAPEALEVAPSPEAYLAEVRRARPVRAALPSLGFIRPAAFRGGFFRRWGEAPAKGGSLCDYRQTINFGIDEKRESLSIIDILSL